MWENRIRYVYLTAAALVVALLVWRVRAVLTPFILALALAYLLEPVVGVLERRQVPRGAAILIAYLVLFGLLTLAWVSLVPTFMTEIEGLVRRLPEQAQAWEVALGRLLQRLRSDTLPEALRGAVDTGIRRIEALGATLASRAAGLVVASLSQVLNLILTPVLAYYILKDRESIARALLDLVPARRREAVTAIALEVDRTLAAVIRGQLLVSSTIGAVTAAGLAILGVRYALLLGLLTGILDIVPYFGPVAAGIPIVAIALASSPIKALWALGILVAANQVESTLLAPKVMSRSAGLHPLAVIGSVLAGAELGGVAGMLIGVPAVSVARSLFVFFRGRRAPDVALASPEAGPSREDGLVQEPAPSREMP